MRRQDSNPESMLLPAISLLTWAKWVLSRASLFPLSLFKGVQLEIHKCEYNPVGLSAGGFLQAPCGSSDRLSGGVQRTAIHFGKMCRPGRSLAFDALAVPWHPGSVVCEQGPY